MKKTTAKSGFSLAETLIALGILAVGMLFIAGVFPVAIQLITVSAERTTAAVVAEEAFAKVQLYGSRGRISYSQFQIYPTIDFNDINTIFNAPPDIGKYEFIYPTTVSSNFDIMQKQYCWSALCRLTRPYNPTDPNQPVQVTVFVCRKAGRTSMYHGGDGNWPVPNRIAVNNLTNNRLRITDPNEKTYVNDDYTIVDDDTGQIYRVVRRLPAGSTVVPNPDEVIQLDRGWPVGNPPSHIWVVPPAVGGGRNPCIAVYQKEIIF